MLVVSISINRGVNTQLEHQDSYEVHFQLTPQFIAVSVKQTKVESNRFNGFEVL